MMRHLREPRIASALFGVVVFITFLVTLAPGVGFIDAGELAAVAHTFGIAHPTGYPLFTLVAGIWARVPFGDGILRLNILAALLTAAAAGTLMSTLWTMLGITPEAAPRAVRRSAAQKGRGQNAQKAPKRRPLSELERLALAAFGASTIAFSRTFWSTGLSIEVYSLHLLCIAIVLRLYVTLMFAADAENGAWRRRWFVFALMTGLAFTNHMTTVLLAPAFLVLFFQRFGFTPAAWKRIGWAVPAFLVGLLPYLFLPLRAAAAPYYNWGNPVDWTRFVWHITGKQFQVWMFSGTEAMKQQLGVFFSTFPAEFGFIPVIVIVIGIFTTFAHGRRLGALLLLLFVTCVAYAVNYNINDIESYFLLAYIVAGFWAAFGLHWIMDRVADARRMHVLAAGALCLGVVIGIDGAAVSQRDNHLVEDYTKNMFQSFQPDAVVIGFQWDYWISASYYYQTVEHLRPDVVVIDKELLRRSWYLLQMQRNHPDVFGPVEKEITAFMTQLTLFEREEPYNPEVIEYTYNAMIDGIIANAITHRPVYLGIEMERHFAPGLVRIPEGLAFRLYTPDAVPSPEAPVWDAFTYRPFARRGRLEDALVSFYARMLNARGLYLANNGFLEQAGTYFSRALEFTPGDPDLLMNLERVRQARHAA